MVELRVTDGTEVVVTRLAPGSATTVDLALLLHQTVSDASIATPHGPCTVPPASLTVTSATICGVDVPISGMAGICAFAILTRVVPAAVLVPMLETQMSPLLSNAIPDAPLNCEEEIRSTGPMALEPVCASCAAV